MLLGGEIPNSTAYLVLQDASYVVREMYEAVAAAAQQYEASGPGPNPSPGVQLSMCLVGCLLHLVHCCSKPSPASGSLQLSIPLQCVIHATELLQAVA